MDSVAVVEVDSTNLTELWPTIISAIKSASFIAIDNELSGLGQRKLINARSVDERYSAICEVAKTRSIISTGISCFSLTSDPGDDPQNSRDNPKTSGEDNSSTENPTSTNSIRRPVFTVQTFSIFVLCKEHYVVEPESLQFLIDHGFDFNRQYATGLPYHRANAKQTLPNLARPCLSGIFAHILLSSKAVVFHNALVDLIFLYQSLHTNTPPSLGSFLADLLLMFPGGIYDTKYITEFKARFNASYLQYVFRKCQKENREAEMNQWSHITVTCSTTPPTHVLHLPCSLEPRTTPNTDVCLQYANHGWCSSGAACIKSHDIDQVLNNEGQLTNRKRRKRKRASQQGAVSTQSDNSGQNSNGTETDETPSNNGEDMAGPSPGHILGHRAGFDAFMTGYAFAFFMCRYGKNCVQSDTGGVSLGGEDFANKVYLGGKDIPLQVVKSNFAKNSKDHKERMAFVKNAGI